MPPRAPPAPGPRPPPRAAGRHGLPPLAPRPWRWLLLLALPAACSALPPPRPVYTNHWAVQVLGGLGAADRVAAAHGYLNLGQVSTAGPARPKLSRPPAATREGAPCQARGQRRRVGRRPAPLGTAGVPAETRSSAVGHWAGRTCWPVWTVTRDGLRPWVPRRRCRAFTLGSVASEARVRRLHLPSRARVDA